MMSHPLKEGYARLMHILPSQNSDHWIIALKYISGEIQVYTHKAPWEDREMRRLQEMWTKGGDSDKELVITWVGEILGFEVDYEFPPPANESSSPLSA